MMRILSLALAASTAAMFPTSAGIELKQENDRLRVLIDGELFTEYRADGHVPCLYPLKSASGADLTRHYPLTDAAKGEAKDHPHHRSFWTTHGLVNGVDFWALPKDPSTRIAHQGFGETKSGSTATNGKTVQRAEFTVDLKWVSKGKTHLNEKRTYTITATDQARTVDVTSVLTAPEADVVFGDTKEGSFAIRMTPTLRLKGEVAKGHAVNSEGVKDKACWGKRAKWVAYYGPDGKGAPTVIAIMDHPKNLRHPTWWHARDYGLVSANPFGIHHFEGKKDKHLGDHTLEKGESLTFQHRFLLHQGTIDSLNVEKAWKEFAAE